MVRGLSVITLSVLSFFSSCTDLIPDDLDALGDDVMITTTEFSPYLGRKTSYENVVSVSNKSTLPLNFKILGARTAEGVLAPEIMEKYPVKIWTGTYTGKETSLEEIEGKRKVEYRSLLEIQEKSGDIVFWDAGDASFIKTLPSEGYLFDVEIANTGGRRYVRNLILKPRRERDYEPSQYDDILGIAKNSYLRPSILYNVFGEKTGMPTSDVRIFIFENTENTSPGNTLTISALDSLGQAIDMRKFKDSEFGHLVHGFNHRFENGKVIYDVAYPMPLINYPTRYTNPSGDKARLNLKYNRLGKGGFLREAFVMFDFAIFREGHWELQIRFNGETPNFENEQ
ncbi:DUF5007 domain-containing protein [Sphingobacterium olei]|uniref:DUF5007 domain-containing protein n=2 Tax=Sphingobacterium olei TaxID=2571155 RepID=A0A4U0NZ11_9SPHI|nr:DUF5007 domain-containing protein [Sphingobacterium olei]